MQLMHTDTKTITSHASPIANISYICICRWLDVWLTSLYVCKRVMYKTIQLYALDQCAHTHTHVFVFWFWCFTLFPKQSKFSNRVFPSLYISTIYTNIRQSVSHQRCLIETNKYIVCCCVHKFNCQLVKL